MCDEQTVLEFSESLTRAHEANMTRQEFPKGVDGPDSAWVGFPPYTRARARERDCGFSLRYARARRTG
jgi:hypothetical protein